MYHFFKWRKL